MGETTRGRLAEGVRVKHAMAIPSPHRIGLVITAGDVERLHVFVETYGAHRIIEAEGARLGERDKTAFEAMDFSRGPLEHDYEGWAERQEYQNRLAESQARLADAVANLMRVADTAAERGPSLYERNRGGC